MTVETASLVWLVDLEPTNRETGEVETFRLSVDGYTSQPGDDPPNTEWEPGLTAPPEVTRSFVSGRLLTGEVRSEVSPVRVHRSPGRLAWTDPRRYRWQNAPALLRVGRRGASLASFKTLQRGVVAEAPALSTTIDFKVLDSTVALDQPFLDSARRLTGIGRCLRVFDTPVKLLSSVTLADGFSARINFRFTSLGDLTRGSGLAALLRTSDATTGFVFQLTSAGAFGLVVRGCTPGSVATGSVVTDPSRWHSAAFSIDTEREVFRIAIDDRLLGEWAYTGAPAESTWPLQALWNSAHAGIDIAHVQAVRGNLTLAEFEGWISEPVPKGLGPATWWWKLDDGAGDKVVDVGPNAEDGSINIAGRAIWIHSQEGGPEQAGAHRYVPIGQVSNITSRLLDPYEYTYLAGDRTGQRVTGVYSSGAPLELSPTDSLLWEFVMEDANGNYVVVELSETGGRTIVEGDYLLYEVEWLDERLISGGTTSHGTRCQVVVQLRFTDGTSGNTDLDQFGIDNRSGGTDLSAYAFQKLYVRMIPLSAHLGKTIDRVQIVAGDPNDGSAFDSREVSARTRRIQITDGFGTLRESLWAPRDGVPVHALLLSNPVGQTYSVEGPDGDWHTEDGRTFTLFNDPQDTLITHDVLGDGSLGWTAPAAAAALLDGAGLTRDSSSWDAVEGELAVEETLGLTTVGAEMNLAGSSGSSTLKQHIDEDPDHPDALWLEATLDTVGTTFEASFSLAEGPYVRQPFVPPNPPPPPNGDHTIELLVRKSSPGVSANPQVTVWQLDEDGNAGPLPDYSAPLDPDGSGEERITIPFDPVASDFLEPLRLRIDGGTASDGWPNLTTVETGALQVRVTRHGAAVTYLVDGTESIREVVSAIVGGAGLSWGTDTEGAAVLRRLTDPDEALGLPTGEARLAGRFAMVADPNAELRVQFWSGAELIGPGECLEYKVLWRPEPGLDPASIAVDLRFDDGTRLADAGLVDAHGLRAAPDVDLSEVAAGRWYSRRIDLGMLTGKTVTGADLVCRKANGGSAAAWVRDVRLRTAGKTIPDEVLWDDSVVANVSEIGSSDPGQTWTLSVEIGSESSPDIELSEDDVHQLHPATLDPPVWSQVVRYGRNHTPQPDKLATSLPLERRLFLEAEYRNLLARRSAIREAFEDAVEGQPLVTTLVNSTDVSRLAEWFLDLFGQPGRGFEVGAVFDPESGDFLALAGGDRIAATVLLTHPDHGLYFGELYRVVRVQIGAGVVTMTLWRPR